MSKVIEIFSHQMNENERALLKSTVLAGTAIEN